MDSFILDITALLLRHNFLVFDTTEARLLVVDIKQKRVKGLIPPLVLACSPKGRFIAIARPNLKNLMLEINNMDGVGIIAETVEEVESDLRSVGLL